MTDIDKLMALKTTNTLSYYSIAEHCELLFKKGSLASSLILHYKFYEW